MMARIRKFAMHVVGALCVLPSVKVDYLGSFLSFLFSCNYLFIFAVFIILNMSLLFHADVFIISA